MKNVKVSMIVIVLFALSLSGCGPAISLLVPQPDGQDAANLSLPEVVQEAVKVNSEVESPAAQVPVGEMGEAVLAMQGTFEQIYEQVNPSVVNIRVLAGDASSDISGFMGGEGSGFVYDDQGHIVTNNHVVANASQITVTFANGDSVDAEVVGVDPNADLAVIKVDLPEDQLQPLTLADSQQVKVGQLAVAIGNPFGLAGTMTTGIVSARARSLPVTSQGASAIGGSYTIPDIIQTDAAINPGNSGGVLVNVNGELIGIPTAIRTDGISTANSGIGFVIPSNIVNRVVPVLIADGEYEHPRIGISGGTLTNEIIDELNLDPGQKGVLVGSVVPNGPADEAGLIGSSETAPDGDIITAIDGQPVTRFEDLTTYLFYNTEVGQKVTLSILRDSQEETVDLTLGTLPSP